MFKIKKINIKKKNIIFFNSFFCDIIGFYIDSTLIIPNTIKIKKIKNKIFFNSLLGTIKYVFKKDLLFFIKNNKIFLNTLNNEKKIKNIYLYNNLLKKKI